MTTNANFKLRLWIAALCLLLPSISLVPFGAVWLWQHGYVLYWVLGACAFVVIAFLIQLYLLRRLRIPLRGEKAPELPGDEAAASWTPRETEAWAAVLTVAETVQLDHLSNWPAFLGLGQRTVEAVAKSLHPDVEEPLWQFTVPEALTLIERVSLRLRPVIIENIPLGDQLTVAQVLRVYEWRSAIDVAQKGYDIWRIIRMLNPASAVTQELRERLSRQMYLWGRDELAKRLVRGYVKEVGRAAIDLYGGRLRVSPEALESHMSAATMRDREAAGKLRAEPLRLLVCGQLKAGKSSLINALLNEVRAASDVLPATSDFTAYEIKREGVPQALILDTPGLADLAAPLSKLIEEASQGDLIIWVVSAVRADREIDRRALDAIRRFFADRPNRRRPPMVLVVSHIDRLKPPLEWQPPYDITGTGSPKAASIRAALQAAGEDLGFAEDDIIPACLDLKIGIYNVDTIWAEIMERMPEAQRAQLVRVLQDAGRRFDWRRLRTQALNAGRILAESAWQAAKNTPPQR